MAHTRKDRTTPDFLTHFEAVEDPRQAAKVAYPLDEVLLLVLCAVISGAYGWTSIALYGEKKLQFLRRFLPFKHGTPSHDQLGILFSRLDMEAFQRCFIACQRDTFGPDRVCPPLINSPREQHSETVVFARASDFRTVRTLKPVLRWRR